MDDSAKSERSCFETSLSFLTRQAVVEMQQKSERAQRHAGTRQVYALRVTPATEHAQNNLQGHAEVATHISRFRSEFQQMNRQR